MEEAGQGALAFTVITLLFTSGTRQILRCGHLTFIYSHKMMAEE